MVRTDARRHPDVLVQQLDDLACSRQDSWVLAGRHHESVGINLLCAFYRYITIVLRSLECEILADVSQMQPAKNSNHTVLTKVSLILTLLSEFIA